MGHCIQMMQYAEQEINKDCLRQNFERVYLKGGGQGSRASPLLEVQFLSETQLGKLGYM